MAKKPWYLTPRPVWQAQQQRILECWLTREVLPFVPYWSSRLPHAMSQPPSLWQRLRRPQADGRLLSSGRATESGSHDLLNGVGTTTLAQLARAGGPGNPDLMMSPTEDQFKRHAALSDLLAASFEAAGGRHQRRNTMWRRFKPVHVHEAGVDELVAVGSTRSDLEKMHLAGARLAEVLGWVGTDRLVNVVPQAPALNFWGIYHAGLASRVTALHTRSAGRDLATALHVGLAQVPATVLTVPFTELNHLGAVFRELLGNGRSTYELLQSLRMIGVVGGVPTASVRQHAYESLASVLGRPVEIRAIWGPDIGRCLYGEPPRSDNDRPESSFGLITYPDLELLETYDPETERFDPRGGAGELVVSSIGFRGTTFVRAATGTWVGGIERVSNHPLNEATMPRLAPALTEAAWQPRIDTTAGWQRPDLRGISRVIVPLAKQAGVIDWSLRPQSNRLVLALNVPPRSSQQRLQGIAEAVGRHCGVVPDIVENVADAGLRPRVGAAGPPV